MVLCSTCLNVFQPTPAETESEADVQAGWSTRYAARSGDELRAASESGCMLCAQVWKSLDEWEKDVLFDPQSSGLLCRVFWGARGRSFTAINISFDKNNDPGYRVSRKFDPLVEIETGTVQEKNNTPEVLELCRNWLNECQMKHGICHEHVGETKDWLPTRLIDVGTAPVHLVDSNNLMRSEPYLALSHCWGKIVVLTLLQTNLNAFQKEIPFSSLPLTFVHAMVTTRQLGYRYLWIDSLCIIQDSVDDWRHEASLMGDVYSKADCVLAATGSRDGSEGLFHKREPIAIEPFAIQASWPSDSKKYTCIRSDVWTDGVVNAPLNQRGWVVQERMLAPRTIHFGAKEIFWECRQLEACETLPRKIPTDLISFGSREGDGFKRWMEPIKRGADEVDGPMEAWRYVVEVYMRSALTKGEDKLIALSGMAIRMSILLRDTYLAGLWKNDLVNGMVWWVEEDATGQDSRRWPSYRAPSWSWVAIDGPINYTNASGLYGHLVKILDVDVQPVGDDVMGQVRSGHIQLEGNVISIQKPVWYHAPSMNLCGKYFPDDREESDSVEEFYALPLGYYRITPEDEQELWGILMKTVASLPDTFARVGFFRVSEGENVAFVGNLKPEVVENFGQPAGMNRRIITLV